MSRAPRNNQRPSRGGQYGAQDAYYQAGIPTIDRSAPRSVQSLDVYGQFFAQYPQYTAQYRDFHARDPQQAGVWLQRAVQQWLSSQYPSQSTFSNETQDQSQSQAYTHGAVRPESPRSDESLSPENENREQGETEREETTEQEDDEPEGDAPEASQPSTSPPNQYVCLQSGCRERAFSRFADLQRHVQTRHNRDISHDCPLARFHGCRRKPNQGGRGFGRLDKVYEHLRSVHQVEERRIDIPAKPPGDVALTYSTSTGVLYWVNRA